MTDEFEKIKQLFEELIAQPEIKFPPRRKSLEAPRARGVYIIRRGQKVLHVGSTPRGKNGLHQRLRNHLDGISEFARVFLSGDGNRLRIGHTYQCLVVPNKRPRALLEHYAIGVLCPAHLGDG